MVEKCKEILLIIKSIVRKYGSKFVFSLGLGGVISLYIIQLFRVKILPFMTSTKEIYEVLADKNIVSINGIEILILIVSVISLISAPLLSKNEFTKGYEVFILISLLFFEMIGILSILVSKEMTNLFIIGTTIVSIYLVWLTVDILKITYSWTKIDRSIEQQVDVTKLTFIWALIVFLIGLFK